MKASWARVARRIRVPLGFLFALFYLWLARPSPLYMTAGLLLMFPGLALRALASGYVRKDRELTSTGPYAYTRNPLYLGSLLIAAGFAVAARNWWIALATIALFAAVYLPVVWAEEERLRRAFPGYAAYAAQVPRFIPRLSPAEHSQAQGFSRELYLQHREYNAALGSGFMLMALAAKLLWFSH